MKFGLQRIGAMLEQLNTYSGEPDASIAAGTPTYPTASASMTQTILSPFPQPLKSVPSQQPSSEAQMLQPNVPTDVPDPAFPHAVGASLDKVQPFPTQATQALALPHAKAVSVSHHRNATNPNLAVSLLKDIETTVVAWQLELEQTILQIQAVYADGPIVEGWLESQASHVQSQASASSADMATLRHGEVDRLMDYVEAICHPNSMPSDQAAPTQAQAAAQAGVESYSSAYRLCGLDADGRLWSRSCPTQQVPYVSLAIARYQKLRILLSQKQTLENRLNQLIQSLTVLSGQIQKN
jgi:hypothetical protein